MRIEQQGGRAETRAALVARLLAGAWRTALPPLDLSPEDLREIVPLLRRSASAGMAWWRVRSSNLAAEREAEPLRQEYRSQSIHAVLQERAIVQAVTLLRADGIEPLLIKGWSIARLYPEAGLRPYGDIDLCVRPEQYQGALSVMNSPGGLYGAVDLHGDFNLDHVGYSMLDDCSIPKLYERSEIASLNGVEVRVLCPEDHLRLLCLHLLGHGAWRPLWLCDIAVALETRPPAFDWKRCLGEDRRRADWVACALGLAHRLLDARVEDTPITERAQRLPRWLVPGVLRQWEVGDVGRRQMVGYLRRPLAALAEVPRHWPNGIEATIGVRGPFNDWPRLPFQLAAGAKRTAEFAFELSRRRRQPQ
jgi:hypothetical protein